MQIQEYIKYYRLLGIDLAQLLFPLQVTQSNVVAKKLSSQDYFVHVLKVLHMLDLHDLPTQYYLKRWTKDAVAGIILGTHDENMKVDYNPFLTTRYSELSHLALAMATKGCETKQLSLVAKRALLRSLDEIKSYSESHPPHHTEIEERNQDLMGDNITLRDPPRKKVTGQLIRRFKSALEKRKDPQTSIETIERSSRSVVK